MSAVSDLVLDEVKKLVADQRTAVDDFTKKLNEATAASQRLEGELKVLKTENDELRKSIRSRSGGGYVKEQEERGCNLGEYILRCYQIQKRGKSVKDAFLGAEFMRDEVLRMIGEHRRSLSEMIDRGEAPEDARVLLSINDAQIGYLVPNQLGGFIDLARPQIIASELGARGPVTVTGQKLIMTKQTGKSTWSATAEAQAPTAQDKPTYGVVELMNKGYTGMVEVTTQAMEIGGPDVQERIVRDLTLGYAELVDNLFFNGSGVSGNPKGLLLESTVGSVTTSGTMSWDKAVDFVAKSLAANRRGLRYGFACHPLIWGAIMKTKDTTNRPIFAHTPGAAVPTTLLNYPIRTSTQITGTSGSGVLLFGPYDSSVIYEWLGGMKVKFSEHFKFNQQITSILGAAELNMLHEWPESFVKATDLNT